MSYRDDDDDRVEKEDGTDMDPEKYLLRLEEEDKEDAEVEDLFEKIEEILKDFPESERKMFTKVFVEGESVTEAARNCGVRGAVHAKFNRMLEIVRGHMA